MRERCVATAQDTRCMSLGNAPQRPAEPKRGAATAPPRRRPAARAVAAARRQAAAWAARHARRRRGRQRGAARRNARVVLRSTAAPCHDDARAAEGVVVSGRASRALRLALVWLPTLSDDGRGAPHLAERSGAVISPGSGPPHHRHTRLSRARRGAWPTSLVPLPPLRRATPSTSARVTRWSTPGAALWRL